VTDKTTELACGIDLIPLVTDESRDVVENTLASIDRFEMAVQEKLRKRWGH
jgi:hypothetical protein